MKRIKKWKPTREACRIVRECARRVSGHGRPSVEPAYRTNLESGETHMNLAYLRSIGKGETDLDTTTNWKFFLKGFHLMPSATEVMVEFWCYDPEELKDQVIATFDVSGNVVRVEATYVGGYVLYDRKHNGPKGGAK